jgi:uncharacterized protein YjbI with pentapeptide repeats
VLAAWVRETTSSLTRQPGRVATDVQAALTVIGRRTPVHDERRVDLTWAVLPQARLAKAQLDRVILSDAYLEGADFSQAHLKDADFTAARLEDANFANARLERAGFSCTPPTCAFLLRAP